MTIGGMTIAVDSSSSVPTPYRPDTSATTYYMGPTGITTPEAANGAAREGVTLAALAFAIGMALLR
jgi:hypothetical protein